MAHIPRRTDRIYNLPLWTAAWFTIGALILFIAFGG